MGGGIAMSFANAGIPVTLIEINNEALERGLGIIDSNYAGSVKRGKLSEEQAKQCRALINASIDYASLADVDLVIEAVFEDFDLKVKKGEFISLIGHSGSHRVQSMHSSGSITRKFGPSWKQSTGQTSTQSVYLHLMQASPTT